MTLHYPKVPIRSGDTIIYDGKYIEVGDVAFSSDRYEINHSEHGETEWHIDQFFDVLYEADRIVIEREQHER